MRIARLLLALGLATLGHAALADSFWMATLTGSEEVPPNDSKGYGFAAITLTDSGNMLIDLSVFQINFPNIAAAHIHNAPRGENGPVVFGLFDRNQHGQWGNPLIREWHSVPDTYISELKAGRLYVNVHTDQYNRGEIRGQIVPVPEPAALSLLGFGLVPLVRRRK